MLLSCMQAAQSQLDRLAASSGNRRGCWGLRWSNTAGSRGVHARLEAVPHRCGRWGPGRWCNDRRRQGAWGRSCCCARLRMPILRQRDGCLMLGHGGGRCCAHASLALGSWLRRWLWTWLLLLRRCLVAQTERARHLCPSATPGSAQINLKCRGRGTKRQVTSVLVRATQEGMHVHGGKGAARLGFGGEAAPGRVKVGNVGRPCC